MGMWQMADDALTRAEKRGKVVRLGGLYMLETTRKTAVESLTRAITARGGEIISVSGEKRDSGGMRRQTVYTIVAWW